LIRTELGKNVNAQLTGSIAIGHETLTLSEAGGFASIPSGATKAEISIDDTGSDIRYWIDGTDPTTMQGHYRYAGDQFMLLPPNPLANFKAIPVSGSATLQITYY